MAMTFGIHIGHMGGPWSEMRRLWKFADDMGFDWFSVSDHFQESPPQGGDLDCFEAVTTMTAAALETKRVRIGSLVYCINYRNPGVLAAALTTVDHLSNGRLECGIGAGWHAHEYEAFGIPFEKIGVREDMLEEYAQCLKKLFDPADKVSSFEGTHYVWSTQEQPQACRKGACGSAAGRAPAASTPATPMAGTSLPFAGEFKAKSLIRRLVRQGTRTPARSAHRQRRLYIGAEDRGPKGRSCNRRTFGKDREEAPEGRQRRWTWWALPGAGGRVNTAAQGPTTGRRCTPMRR